jgi:hypothetical protein
MEGSRDSQRRGLRMRTVRRLAFAVLLLTAPTAAPADAYVTTAPEHTPSSTTSYGDPVTGRTVISDNGASFLAPSGKWTLEWQGTFVTDSIWRETQSANPVFSAPVVYVLLPA